MNIAEKQEAFLEAVRQIKAPRDKEWADMISDYEEKGYDVLPLWPDGAPGFHEEYGQEQPRIIVYPAHEGKATGSFILCVGGGFYFKTYNEAVPVADYFYKKGFHMALLDYRVLPYERMVSVADGLRAIRFIRRNAEKYNVDPTHVAIGGFSAGGVLSNLAGCVYTEGNADAADKIERYSSRPDAVIVGYGAFSEILNVGTGLAFDFADQRKAARLSPDLLLNPDCPPRFLFQTVTDDPRNISNMQMRLAEMGIPFEAHCFMGGSHGNGLYDGRYEVENVPHTAHWAELAAEWLCDQGFPVNQE